MLGDILLSTQPLITHLVILVIWSYGHILPMMITTFLGHTGRVVPSNKMGILSRSVCFVHSRARDADMILFWPKFVTIMSVTFCRTDHSKKKSWHSDWPSGDRKHVTCEACIGRTNRFEYHVWASQLSTWRWHGFCFSQIFLWHWQLHFAALGTIIVKIW